MEIARYWRLKKQLYRLLGEICPHCDTKMFPPRDVCTGCGINVHAEHEPVQVTVYKAPQTSGEQPGIS